MNVKKLLTPSLVKEFFRYAIVGGVSFLADFGTLTLFEEVVLGQWEEWRIFVSTAAGFVVGLLMNYILSLVFVFRSSDNRSSGKSIGEFVIFALVGVVGLGITEGLMHLGVNVLHFHYMITKIVTAGIVLVWNYLGRKILVFNRPKGEKK